MGLESKEKVLWVWIMEEYADSKGSFWKVVARGTGKQESREWNYVCSSLGNGRIRNPVVYGLGILACGAGF